MRRPASLGPLLLVRVLDLISDNVEVESFKNGVKLEMEYRPVGGYGREEEPDDDPRKPGREET
jgi:hypothetical protein